MLPSVHDGKQAAIAASVTWRAGQELVRRCVALGAVEGFDGAPVPLVDGRDLDSDAMCLRALHRLLDAELPAL